MKILICIVSIVLAVPVALISTGWAKPHKHRSPKPLPTLSLKDSNVYVGKDANGYGFERLSGVSIVMQRRYAGNIPVTNISLDFDYSNSFNGVGMEGLPSRMFLNFINSHGQQVNQSPVIQDLTALDVHCTYHPNPMKAHFDISTDLNFVGKDIKTLRIDIPNSSAAGSNKVGC